MTFLGKTFVMVNVSISLLMAFIAMGLFFNGTDWGYDVAEPGKQGGLIEKKKKEIADLQQTQIPSEGSWKKARPVLWKAEEERRSARAEYVKHLQHNRETAKPGSPAQAVDVEEKQDAKRGNYKEAKRQKAPMGHLPQMFDAKVRGDKEDLYSRAHYRAELDKTAKENRGILEQLAEESKKTEALNKQIYDKATDSGLEVDLVKEREKREAVQEERKQIRPLYVNTAVESELSLKRLAAMRKQIADLKAYCAKRGIDVQVVKR